MQLIANTSSHNQADGAESINIHLSTPPRLWDEQGHELTGDAFDNASYEAFDKTQSQTKQLIQGLLGEPTFGSHNTPDPNNRLGFAPTIWVLPGITLMLQETDCSFIITLNLYEN